MILEVTMYTVKCDRCGEVSGEGEEICAWNEAQFAVNEAVDSFDWEEVDDKHYCPNCLMWDDEETVRIPRPDIEE